MKSVFTQNIFARTTTLVFAVGIIYTGGLLALAATQSHLSIANSIGSVAYADGYGYDGYWDDGGLQYDFGYTDSYVAPVADVVYDGYWDDGGLQYDFGYTDSYVAPMSYDYYVEDYSYDYYTPSYSYGGGSSYTPSYSSGGGFAAMPSISTPSYSSGGSGGSGYGGSSYSGGSTSYASGGYSGGNSFTTGDVNQEQDTGDVTQIVNIPAMPQQTASQPIEIINNNVNTNVNNNGYVAPVVQQPVYKPKPKPQESLQCAVYATASSYQGGKVTVSWATSGGYDTELYCTNGVLGTKNVDDVDTQIIYPWNSTTCYVTVKSSTDSKTCSTYIPVEKKTVVTYTEPKPTYTPPTPTYTPTVTYVEPQPTYTPAPTVTVASAIIPTYKTITLSETPYTGYEDWLYPMFLVALALTAAYAVTQRRRLFNLA